MFGERIDCDVLVVGGGFAAIRAALASTKAGAKTVMMLKGVLGKSGSSAIAGGGLAAVMGVSDVPEDSIEKHYLDTLTAGDFINDTELVKQLVLRAPQAIRELEDLGAEFVKKPSGELEVFHLPAHSCRRSVRVAGGGTARMMGPLSECVRREPILLYESTTALEVLQEGRKAVGALAVRGEELLLFRASAVVLASGGAGQIYTLTSNMKESTGDGYAIAMRNGLALTGMEFLQFNANALAYPKELEGTSTGGVLLSLPGTKLWNKLNERFMEKYDPERKEASTRAMLAHAIQTEVAEGRGSPHGGVFLDLTRNDAETLKRLVAPFMAKLAPYGIDITRDSIEIAPVVHYFMGGVEINALAETGLAGLYAAGEVAGGIHGSNRLNSNSLSEVNVFGRLAGEQAASFAARTRKRCSWRNLEAAAKQRLPGLRRGRGRGETLGEQLETFHAELKQIMFASAGLVRNAAAMSRGVTAIRALRAQLCALTPVSTTDLKRFYEVRNMLDVGEAVTLSAFYRKESRGAHIRTDCPDRDDARWSVATRVFWQGKTMSITDRSSAEDKELLRHKLPFTQHL